VKYFIKFLMAMKKKENGNFLSFTDLRKYKDVILWSASMAEERLPTTFYEEIEKLLKGYKKELVKARRDGNTDERVADPISFALYHLLLTWSAETSETNSTCKLTVLRVEPHVISAHKRMRIIPCYFLTELHDVRFILL
jgi:hypothetical protein